VANPITNAIQINVLNLINLFRDSFLGIGIKIYTHKYWVKFYILHSLHPALQMHLVYALK